MRYLWNVNSVLIEIWTVLNAPAEKYFYIHETRFVQNGGEFPQTAI